MMKIQRNEVHLWCVHDQQIVDPELLLSYQSLLSPMEEKRLNRFIFPKHRHQFLITRALVRSILADYCDIANPAELTFGKNSYGKPFLTNESNKTALNFNLTHTEGLVVLAVTGSNIEVGVDVELLQRKADILKLAERYFSSIESAELKALESPEHKERFFTLWTLKEAFIKACGKGLSIPLESFSFNIDKQKISATFAPELEQTAESWRFLQVDTDSQYKLSLALQGEGLEHLSVVVNSGIPLRGFSQHPASIVRSS